MFISKIILIFRIFAIAFSLAISFNQDKPPSRRRTNKVLSVSESQRAMLSDFFLKAIDYRLVVDNDLYNEYYGYLLKKYQDAKK